MLDVGRRAEAKDDSLVSTNSLLRIWLEREIRQSIGLLLGKIPNLVGRDESRASGSVGVAIESCLGVKSARRRLGITTIGK